MSVIKNNILNTCEPLPNDNGLFLWYVKQFDDACEAVAENVSLSYHLMNVIRSSIYFFLFVHMAPISLRGAK